MSVPGFPGNDKFRPGGFYRISDRDGHRARNYNTKKEWNGLWVGSEEWEARQPQDFVRGVPDVQTVPDARPPEPILDDPSIYTGPNQTSLTAATLPGGTVLTVQQSAGFTPGSLLNVFLDSLDGFLSHVASLPDTTHIVIVDPLPGTASAQNLVISYLPRPAPTL